MRLPFVKKLPQRKVKKKPSDESVQIGQRLKQIRFDSDLSQHVAAQELRISRAQLINYEEARTPLRVEVALDVCSTFIYSEKWLATGEGEARQLMNLRDDPIARKVKRGTFFGAAYREILAPHYERLLAGDPDAIRFAPFGFSACHDKACLDLFTLCWDILLADTDKSAQLMSLLLASGDRFVAQSVDDSDFDFSPDSALHELGIILPAKQILRTKQALKIDPENFR